jgi:hypothetical protein
MAVTFDDLMGACAVDPAEFSFRVGGHECKARPITDGEQLYELETRAKLMHEAASAGRGGADMQPWLPVTLQTMRMAVYCEALLIEPRLSVGQALALQKRCGLTLMQIGAELMGRSGVGVEDTEEAAIEDEKNA